MAPEALDVIAKSIGRADIPTRSDAAARVLGVDLARGLALGGMILFHAVRDFEIFGLLPAGYTLAGPWAWFARLVAGSFLFIAGVSFFLAHRDGLRWPAFTARLGQIAAAAALVSLATYAAMPDRFVFFGILHMIVVASLAGPVLLRLPVAALLVLAAVALLLPLAVRSPLFDAPALLWVGLSTHVPATLDYLPVLPWLAPFALGLAAGRLAQAAGLWARAARWPAGRGQGLVAGLAWLGRHSLAVYLLHQPILLAALWGWLRLTG